MEKNTEQSKEQVKDLDKMEKNGKLGQDDKYNKDDKVNKENAPDDENGDAVEEFTKNMKKMSVIFGIVLILLIIGTIIVFVALKNGKIKKDSNSGNNAESTTIAQEVTTTAFEGDKENSENQAGQEGAGKDIGENASENTGEGAADGNTAGQKVTTTAADNSQEATTEMTTTIIEKVEVEKRIPAEEVKGEIVVKKVEGISDDFIRGVDASSYISEVDSGVKYKDEDGNEKDLFEIFAEEGVNYIRIRVWNDPYDKNGNGYGGGNNDVDKAIKMGQKATALGMKVLIDFHYSDFWADPSKQMTPKAWKHITFANKEILMYDWTKETLAKILAAGVDVGMVQIGNEINNGLAGETENTNICALLEKASSAVRETAAEFEKDVKIVIHYTNISDASGIEERTKMLSDAGIDYDVFAVSYYIFWHGTIENMQNVLSTVKEKYGKDVMVAETSYAYTLEDGDGHGNSVSEKDLNSNYAATVQSQATALRDVCAAVNEIGGLGVFYWEPAWIPVTHYDYTADNAEEVLAANKQAWEKYGSGWASSYAGSYDKEDAGEYYGGCAWDNQAWFDFDGNPLPSLYVYKCLKYGSVAELSVDFLKKVEVDCNIGSELNMPEEIEVVYNDRSYGKEGKEGEIDEIHLENISSKAKVTWNAEDIAAIDTSVSGDYEVRGTTEDGTELTAAVHVAYVNTVSNNGFEEKDTSMWNVEYSNATNPTDYQKKESDAFDGEMSLHFWLKDEEPDFTLTQEITDIPAGVYQYYFEAQGGDVGSGAELEAFVKVGDKEYTKEFSVNGWVNWQEPRITDIEVADGDTVTVGVRIKTAKGGWGTLDAFYFGVQP